MKHRIGCFISAGRVNRVAPEYGAELASVFLGNPRSFNGPLANIKEPFKIPIYAHAPYAVDIPHHDPWVFKAAAGLLVKHAELAKEHGCLGLVVHAGSWKHSSQQVGLDKWKAVADKEFPVPILIENQAGGKHPMAHTLQQNQQLWDVVKHNPMLGYCLDTAHVWAATTEPVQYIRSLKEIVGKFDLVHANNSAAAIGSGTDKHSPIATGQIPLKLELDMIRACGCRDLIAESSDPVIDIEILRHALNPEGFR